MGGAGRMEKSANPRLLRHYQTVGCVSRPPERDGGRFLVYGYRQLLESLAVRVLLDDGWSLPKIGEALARLEEGDIERLLETRTLPMPNPTLSRQERTAAPDVAELPAAASEAMKLIKGFRQPGQPSLAELTRPAAAATLLQATPVVARMSEHRPAPWLRIAVDDAAMASADRATVLRAIDQAMEVLTRLRP
jgi:DNA-binding transcriptional MerR regulator